ncbi:MAG: D-alanyl-D-alanine carboxypeptidase family protein [Wujia sp.]
MFTKEFVRNCIIFVLAAFFILIVCVINNHVSHAYPDLDDHSYVVEHLLYQSNGVDFRNDDTVVYREDCTQAQFYPDSYFTLLVNESDHKVLAAKNVHQRMYPASMTKVMTAIVVADQLEAGNIRMDDMVTVKQHYDLTSRDVAPCPLYAGFQISVKDLLYGLMIESNNYYALILADHIGGGEEGFVALMNEKATEIGATNSHFMNPHGLDDVNHYTTAYDMYLIMKEAYSHDVLREIDQYDTYEYYYLDSNGVAVDMESESTNMFITGEVSLPATFEIELWKTGTTSGAGNCLAMCLKKEGKSYIVVASSGESKQNLYDSIIKLLCLIK